ncbi:MAG: tetratricopeptide repeat protein [Deltaproteobacteria bacterium]|nr:tetratricopeptide repeat protein [Deltaproteobacteria bacterium]
MSRLWPLAGGILALALALALGCAAPAIRTSPSPTAAPAAPRTPARPLPPAASSPVPLPPLAGHYSQAEHDRSVERLRSLVATWEAPTHGPGNPALRVSTARLQAVMRPGVDPRALRASAMEVLGDPRRALADLRVLAGQAPPPPAAVCRYATLAVREGRGREAETFLSSCAERDAGNPELRGVLGWIFLAQDEPGKARPHLEATWGTPVAERYAVFLARVRLLAGDLGGAADAALLATRNAEAAPAAWTLLGDAQRARGLAAPAEEAYRKALSLRPGDYAASVNLGVLWLGQGKPAEAEALFAAAASARPGAPEAWANLGLARKVQGDYRGAREVLEKALAADPECAPALKDLGIVNEKYLGRPADALPYYDRYLAVRPGDAEVERWRKAAARLAAGGGTP